MSQANAVTVRFYPPPEDLRGCFTTFYVTELDPGEDGLLHDCLHPEWAGMRFFNPSGPSAWMDDGQRHDCLLFQAAGPTSHPIHFAMPKTRMWGFGFLPLGWARYVRLPAAAYADKLCDGHAEPLCAPFRPLAESLFGPEPDEAAELARIIAFFRDFRAYPLPEEKRIVAIHAALVDPEVVTVTDLVGRVAASQRTVERLCHRHFGFSPKLLLRRQRFLRTLQELRAHPGEGWASLIDAWYYDQSHFVRDFHRFMGMSPSAYFALPHQLLGPAARARMAALGASLQGLHAAQADGSVLSNSAG